MATELVKCNAACRALSAPKSGDAVKDIRDKAVAMQLYAKQARNRQLEIDASEIRIRAERRLGEMLKKRSPQVGARGRPDPGRGKRGAKMEPRFPVPARLSEMGIDKKLSGRAQELVALPQEDFEGKIGAWRGRVERDESRVCVDLLAPKVRVSHNSGDNEWYTPYREVAARAIPNGR
jgi:hypothetical protein